jgi:hypothetical protein
MRKLLYLFIAFMFLVSCDCSQNIRGVILDRHTKEPIENVEIYNKNKTWSKTQTDGKGFFSLSNVSGGLTCPPMTIIIEHKEYESFEIAIESGSQKEILLTRKINQYKDALTYNQAMKNIKDIFEEYKTNEESIESEDNKVPMTKSLNNLHNVTDKNDLELLINIWNYYDPTDYCCRGDIYRILMENKIVGINAVKDRIKNRMSWEDEDLSGTDFKYLLEQLEKEYLKLLRTGF